MIRRLARVRNLNTSSQVKDRETELSQQKVPRNGVLSRTTGQTFSSGNT